MYYVSKAVQSKLGDEMSQIISLQIIPENGKLMKDKKTGIMYIKNTITTYIDEGISQIPFKIFDKNKPIRFEVHPKLPNYTIFNEIDSLTNKVNKIELYRMELAKEEKFIFIKTLIEAYKKH